ncbi:chemotaxis protein CheA [Pseudooceanicola sp.]|uniref:chemotaxis protein CheA n=1 Tax=Pseudooceanicola sp. TaxID=1914328 RepID=UPI00261B76A7|nr:chemotaxis protein CheA [Pseudooceanicola sp.]MDF1854079.1 chemotaxis protein CheA [Pseudooceanicola sp.]
MSDPIDPMAEIRASFFVECEELLEALQDGLTELENGDGDPETINVVFRAVHSIKGGAGAFGLEPLVRFAHRYETVLEEVRAHRLAPVGDAIRLFFEAADHLSDLVRACRDDLPTPEASSDALLAELDALLADPEPEETKPVDSPPLGVAIDLPDLDPVEEPKVAAPLPVPPDNMALPFPHWLIRFRPESELYKTGNEPLLLLRQLAQLGECHVDCDITALPALTDLKPEQPYLNWTIQLDGGLDEADIRDVFEFVDGLCDLQIDRVDGPENLPPPGSAAPTLAPKIVDLPRAAPSPPATEVPLATVPHHPDRIDEPHKSSTGATAKSVVRVDLERIERLVNLIGELVINQAMLAQSLDSVDLSPHSDAMNGLEEFQRLTRDIQDSVIMIRAQPVKPLFQRMSRIVREASSAVGKEVRLITEGETTEIDKTVIERLTDPLTHMIRNAIDHGFEDAPTRQAAGKPSEGQLRLSAAHRSGRVVIEVSDDGGGINRARVHQIAVEKGLIPVEAVLSDSEIDNLLFLPGLSTAAKSTDLSGRGVGMDVVRTAIQALGGRISIASEQGKGTAFTLSLPLTLAVLDGMVINVAGETLVLPLNVVIESLSLSHDDVQMLRPGAFLVRVRGDFVPLYDLGAMLGYRAARTDYNQSNALLISLDDDTRAALLIDGIEDQRQVVIKGLDDSFYRAPGIAAATILGDGQIALIIDPGDIIAGSTCPRSTDPGLPEKRARYG